MKKIALGLFILISCFVLLFIGVNTKAVSAPTMVTGASIRTTGDHQGLKFSATVDSLEGVTEHGFYVALGEHTQSAMATAAGADATGVDGKKLKKVEVTGENTTFHAVIYNIPEASYGQVITAIAYVSDGSSKTFSTEVMTRNIAEVACTAKSNGINSDIVNDVIDYMSNNYMVKTMTSTYEFVISKVLTINYNHDKLDDLWADFISDYNAATGASLTTSCTQAAFHASLSTGIANNDVVTFSSTSNAVKFFSGKNLVKWGWILEYFDTYGTTHVKNQANGLLRYDRTVQSYGKGYKLIHLNYSIYNLFTNGSGQGGYPAVSTFDTLSKYNNVVWPVATDFNSANVVSVDESINLPSTVTRNGYEFVEFINGSTPYDGGASFTITTTPQDFTSTFNAISYDLDYVLNGGSDPGNPSSYTIETATIDLISPTKVGYIFAGWYGNSSFTGDPITQIIKGSTGNKTLYAKFVDADPVDLDIDGYNAANKSVLNTITPDIVVIPGLSAGKYNIINTTNVDLSSVDYTTGVNLFSTIEDAISAASTGNVVYVFSGTYTADLTINKSLTLIGSDKGITLAHTATYTTGASHTKLSGKIDINASNVTIQGFELNNQIQILGTNGDITLKELVITVSGKNEVLYTKAGSVITTLLVDKVYAAASNNRIVYIYGTVTDLTVQNSAVLDSATGVVDFVRAGSSEESTLRGTINFNNNYVDCTQSAFHERNAGANTYNFYNNYFNDMPNAIYSKNLSTKTGITYNIMHNTFYSCLKSDKAWDVIEIDPSASKIVNINYNAFANTGTRANCYSISVLGTATVNADNNYFKASADRVVNNVSPTNWALETATTTANTYDNYKIVQIGDKYYVYGVNLTTAGS